MKDVKMGRREWCNMMVHDSDSQAACLSWFRNMVPEQWGMPVAAQVQEDIETGRETAIRALFRLPDGTVKQALRRNGVRTFTISLKSAPLSVTKSARVSLP